MTTEFAALAISFYLTTDHPILGLFDADLFLGDLVARKLDFCTPLLLNALLAFACVRIQSPVYNLEITSSHLILL